MKGGLEGDGRRNGFWRETETVVEAGRRRLRRRGKVDGIKSKEGDKKAEGRRRNSVEEI